MAKVVTKQRGGRPKPKASVIAEVTLLGEKSTNPQIPPKNVRGELLSDPAGLQFRTFDRRFKYVIPWDHFASVTPEVIKEPNGWLWRGAVWAAALFIGVSSRLISITGPFSLAWLLGLVVVIGIPLYFFFAFNPVQGVVTIKAWDEELGMDVYPIFSIGPTFDSPRLSIQLARAILSCKRGSNLDKKIATKLVVNWDRLFKQLQPPNKQVKRGRK